MNSYDRNVSFGDKIQYRNFYGNLFFGFGGL